MKNIRLLSFLLTLAVVGLFSIAPRQSSEAHDLSEVPGANIEATALAADIITLESEAQAQSIKAETRYSYTKAESLQSPSSHVGVTDGISSEHQLRQIQLITSVNTLMNNVNADYRDLAMAVNTIRYKGSKDKNDYNWQVHLASFDASRNTVYQRFDRLLTHGSVVASL